MRFFPIFLLLVSCSTPYWNRPVQQRASVIVGVICADSSNSGGSGVVINNRHILTAKHVVSRCPNELFDIWVLTANNRVVHVSYDKASNDDVVRLFASYDFATSVPAVGNPQLGDKVCVVFPRRKWLYTCGSIIKTIPNRIVLDIVAEPGDSGSAVFDSKGNVVGIVSAGTDTTTWAVPISQWEELIEPSEPSLEGNWP